MPPTHPRRRRWSRSDPTPAAGRGVSAPEAAWRESPWRAGGSAARGSRPARRTTASRSPRTTPSRIRRTCPAGRGIGPRRRARRGRRSTLAGLSGRCGSSDPGTAATASRNSRTSAVRMLISRRQPAAQDAQDRRHSAPDSGSPRKRGAFCAERFRGVFTSSGSPRKRGAFCAERFRGVITSSGSPRKRRAFRAERFRGVFISQSRRRCCRLCRAASSSSDPMRR